MVKMSQLLKKPVISIVTGHELGKVMDIVLDDDLNVVALVVGVFTSTEIPINKVRSVRNDSILVEWTNK